MGGSGFLKISAAPMADPEQPQPTPFPIRIVTDALPPPEPPVDNTKKNDFFYEAWDRFLAIEPKRARHTTRLARQIQDEQRRVDRTPGDGLQVKDNAATSWQQAVDECKAKVAAIVAECKRLNRKYVDHMFDLEASPYCLLNLEGRAPQAIGKIDPPPWVKRVEDIFDEPEFM
jgi:hypothetical protein